MSVRSIIRTTVAAAVTVAFKCGYSLLLPIRTIVSVGPALPLPMVRAAMVFPKALAAAIEILAIDPGSTGKGLSAMLADENDFFADMQSSFLGYPFALACFAAESLLVVGCPVRCIWGDKLFAAIVTHADKALASSFAGFIHAITRAICSVARWSVGKDFAADGADMLDAKDFTLACCADVTTLDRATDMPRSATGVGTCSERFVADRANGFYPLGRPSAGVVDVTTSDRAEATLRRRSKTFVANGADRSKHCYTSDSVRRGRKWGTFLGMNACRQIANLSKPHAHYIVI